MANLRWPSATDLLPSHDLPAHGLRLSRQMTTVSETDPSSPIDRPGPPRGRSIGELRKTRSRRTAPSLSRKSGPTLRADPFRHLQKRIQSRPKRGLKSFAGGLETPKPQRPGSKPASPGPPRFTILESSQDGSDQGHGHQRSATQASVESRAAGENLAMEPPGERAQGCQGDREELLELTRAQVAFLGTREPQPSSNPSHHRGDTENGADRIPQPRPGPSDRPSLQQHRHRQEPQRIVQPGSAQWAEPQRDLRAFGEHRRHTAKEDETRRRAHQGNFRNLAKLAARGPGRMVPPGNGQTSTNLRMRLCRHGPRAPAALRRAFRFWPAADG